MVNKLIKSRLPGLSASPMEDLLFRWIFQDVKMDGAASAQRHSSCVGTGESNVPAEEPGYSQSLLFLLNYPNNSMINTVSR